MDSRFENYKGLKWEVDITKEELLQKFPSFRTVRVIYPFTAITDDYRIDRLNVYLDDDDVILKVTIG